MWFSGVPHSLYSLNGYDLISNQKVNKIGGRVAIYISLKFKYTFRGEFNHMTDILESLFVEISNYAKKNVIIGVVYNPP